MNCCSYTCLFISRIIGAVARGGYFSGVWAKKGERKLSTAGGRCKLNLVAKEVITAGTCPSLLHSVYVCVIRLWKNVTRRAGEAGSFFSSGSVALTWLECVSLSYIQVNPIEPDNYNSIIKPTRFWNLFRVLLFREIMQNFHWKEYELIY